MEVFDMYDAQRRPLGHTHPRGVKIPAGEYNVVVQVCVIDARGRLLLTQRHPDKWWGGLWECTAGAVVAGERIPEAAVRELKEETGLIVSEEDIRWLYTYQSEDCFFDCFLTRLPVEGDSLTLTMQEGETVAYTWADSARQEEMEREGLLVSLTVEARKHLRSAGIC